MLAVVLRRMENVVHMRQKIRSLADNREPRDRDRFQEVVDTERFLAVRQIVEKMSVFISQVAGDAQGGMRYFNELPYFVSIHDRKCMVLSANGIYNRYLGNRLYRNSWGIYAGRRGTRNGCPVGRTLRHESVMKTRALVRYASGSLVPVTVHTAPIYDNDGNIDLVIEIFAGTKEIERLAAESRRTHQRYKQLFDAVPSSIVVLDRRVLHQRGQSRFQGELRGAHRPAVLRRFPAGYFPGLSRSHFADRAHRRGTAGRHGADQQRRDENQCNGLDLADQDGHRKAGPGAGDFRRCDPTAQAANQPGPIWD